MTNLRNALKSEFLSLFDMSRDLSRELSSSLRSFPSAFAYLIDLGTSDVSVFQNQIQERWIGKKQGYKSFSSSNKSLLRPGPNSVICFSSQSQRVVSVCPH